MLPRRVEGGWQIGEYHFAENPRFTVPGWCERLVHRWAEMRRYSTGGAASPVLPAGGGYCDQQALVMDAFALFDRWVNDRKGRE